MMTQKGHLYARSSSLPSVIRREMRTETNSRFLRNLPTFRVERDIPERFSRLLERLDEAVSGNKAMR